MFDLLYYCYFNINISEIGRLNVDCLFGFWNILQYNMNEYKKKVTI